MKKAATVLVTVSIFLSVMIHPSAALIGDTNGDGKIGNKDVTTLFRFISDIDVNCVKENCDINGDGSIDNKDVVMLFRYVSGEKNERMSYNENENEDSADFSDLFG